ALGTGNGGRVVVWSDDVTRFYGSLSAQGGALGGNGGSAEVSGKASLENRGFADLRSPFGRTGTLLLDPKFIVIAALGADAVASNDDFAENTAGTSTISPINLATALTGGAVSLRANTDITISDPILSASANTLTLRAGRSIIDDASIALGGAFSATFNDSGATPANRDPGAAVFTMGTSATITAPGGITIQGGTLASDSSGATSIAANTGDIMLHNLDSHGPAVGPSSAGISGGVISIANNAAAGKNIAVTGSIDSHGSSAVGPGNHNGGSGGSVTINASGTLAVDSITTSGGAGVGTGNGGDAHAIALTGGAGITLNNTITAVAGNGMPAGTDGTLTLTATAGG